MDKTELKKLREMIVLEMEQIKQELDGFTVENPAVKGDRKALYPEGDESNSSDEEAQRVTEYERNKATEQMLELRLKELEETLVKINKDEYGVCEKCQTKIDVKRLKAVPAAKICVDCSKKATLI